MRCVSLWQPWASLWICGAKIHETRHWRIKRQWPDWKPGDRLVVHAAKRFVKDHDGAFAGILRQHFGEFWYRDLPTGALIGTIAVTACDATESIFPPGLMPDDMAPRDRVNFECGDFYPGRFGWEGSDPVLFPAAIPFRGLQGVFNVPDDLLAGIA
jgi:hypothetical protein